jgi:hypothetical protein
MRRSTIHAYVVERGTIGILFLALSMLLPLPAAAQTMVIQNGGTVEVDNGGVWNLQGTTVDLGGTGSTASIAETSGGRFANGQLTATRTLNAPSQADPAGLGIEITASANLGDVTVTRGHAIQTGNGNPSIERFYDLSPTQNNSGLDATLAFTYNDAELNGRTESDLEFFKSSDGGTSWSEEGQDSRDATANRVTLSGIESFSRWTLGGESNPLPVALTSFEGAVTKQGVRLTWQTAAETNNAGFEVERTTPESQTWNQIGFLEGHGQGTTHGTSTYSFTDDQIPYEADSLQYRLKQIDLGSTQSETFPPLSIALRSPEQLTLHDNAPNPFGHLTTVRYELPRTTQVRLAVYDLLGRRVKTLVAERQRAGRHQVRLYAKSLASGTYLVRLSAGQTTQTIRVTVSQ